MKFRSYTKGHPIVLKLALAFIPIWALVGGCLFFLQQAQESSFMAEFPQFERTGGHFPYLCFTSSQKIIDRETFTRLCEALGQRSWRKGVRPSESQKSLLVFVLDEPVEVEYPIYHEPRTETHAGTVVLQSSGEQIGRFLHDPMGRDLKNWKSYLKEPNPESASGEADWADIDYHLPVRLEFLKPHIRAMYKGSHAGQPDSERYWFRNK